MQRTTKNYIAIVAHALGKMGPTNLMRNPMMFFVWLMALAATGVFIQELYVDQKNAYLFGQMTLWLWMTVFFACLADSFADSKLPESNHPENILLRTKLVRRVADINKPEEISLEPSSSVKSGYLLRLESGDEIPFDGEVIAGKAYVYETDLTGSLGDSLKTVDGDNKLIAGGDLQGVGDWLIMKVSFARRKSFFAKAVSGLEKIRRHSMPSEVALQRIILGISLLFVTVIFTVAVIAQYSGVNIPFIYLLDLVVILLPTTISGLQRAIIIFARSRLAKLDVNVHDSVALDNAVDVQIALFDKTGTLTVGARQMTDFILFDQRYAKKIHYYLWLSSFQDETHEGVSITRYAKTHAERKKADKNKIWKLDEDDKGYLFHPFTSHGPISGCDYNGLEIRKGSITAIAKYIGTKTRDLPRQVKESTEKIARAHGTPVLFTVNKKIIGVIHLRDRFRKGVMSQLAKLKKEGIQVGLVTGDNELTASYIASKLEMDTFYADCTPERKLAIVKDLQRQGYVVAMCGDGINDALAIAGADIGITYAEGGKVHSILSGNIVSNRQDVSLLRDMRNICKRMTAKRGALTVFSLASDIAKYFVIVPALFTTAFPELAVLNFMEFESLESVILASVMFNALIIFFLTPFIFSDNGWARSRAALWRNILMFGIGGIISPFVGIKLFDLLINYLGLL